MLELLKTSMRSPWFTVLGLSMGTAVSNGLARFAYGLILPAMRSDLHWNFAQAGWINTANAIGYLAGALIALLSIDRVGAKRLFVVGMVLMMLALLASGLTANFAVLTLLRILAGMGGGPAFVAGAALVSQAFPTDLRRTAWAIALYMGGGGIGVVASGLAVPAILAVRGDEAWPVAWLSLGALAALGALVGLFAAQASPTPSTRPRGHAASPLPVKAMAFELAGYFLFGVGYIVYFTFLVAWMRQIGAGVVLVAATWGLLGPRHHRFARALGAGPGAKFKGGQPLALANAATGLGTLLPILAPGPVGILVSAAMFGLSIFIGPAAVTAFGRRNLDAQPMGAVRGAVHLRFRARPDFWPRSPPGLIADAAHNLAYGMAAAASTLFVAAGVASVRSGRPAFPIFKSEARATR